MLLTPGCCTACMPHCSTAPRLCDKLGVGVLLTMGAAAWLLSSRRLSEGAKQGCCCCSGLCASWMQPCVPLQVAHGSHVLCRRHCGRCCWSAGHQPCRSSGAQKAQAAETGQGASSASTADALLALSHTGCGLPSGMLSIGPASCWDHIHASPCSGPTGQLLGGCMHAPCLTRTQSRSHLFVRGGCLGPCSLFCLIGACP